MTLVYASIGMKFRAVKCQRVFAILGKCVEYTNLYFAYFPILLVGQHDWRLFMIQWNDLISVISGALFIGLGIYQFRPNADDALVWWELRGFGLALIVFG